jgi:phage shock protein C
MALYCSGCGAAQPGGANFCSACGRAVVEPGSSGSGFGSVPASPRPPLVRPLVGRKVAGVCRGLANQYGWDVTLTRIIAVLLAVAIFPVGLVAYFVFWLIVPEEPLPAPAITNLNTTV